MTARPWSRTLSASRFVLFAALLLSPVVGYADDLVFGPATCERGTGAPTVLNYSFTAAEPSHGFIFKVYNGGLEDTTYELVSSSTIILNGTEILGPNNFNQNVSYLEVPVSLQAQNNLTVEVRGKPGGAMILKVFPFVVLDSPASGQVLNAQPVSVSGHLYAAASSVVVNGVAAAVSGTSFSVPEVALAEGRNTVTAVATGTGGFVGSDSAEVVLDLTAPVVAITQPAEGLVTNQSVEPQYSVSDAQDPNPAVTILPAPPYLAEGAYQLTVTATDWAGNRADATRSFTIDKTPPTIGSALPAAGSFLTEALPQVTASWSDGLSGLDLTSARLVFDGVDVTSASEVTAASITYHPSAALADGLHQASLAIRDLAGNESSQAWSFTVDATPPEITIASPANGLNTNQEVVLSYTVQDALDANPSVIVTPAAPFIAEGVYHVVITATDQAGNAAQATVDFVIDRTAPVVVFEFPTEGLLTSQNVEPVYVVTDAFDPQPVVSLVPPPPYGTEGSFEVTLTATDRAGNSSAVVRSFVVDKTAPEIAGLVPVANSVTANALVAISANFGDALSGIGPGTAIMTVDGVDVTASATVSENGAVHQPQAQLTDGSHQVTLTVRDRAGNEANAAWTFVVDTAAPIITVASPQEGETVTSSPIAVSGTVDDAGSTVTVNGSAAVLTGTSFAVSGIELAVGQNEIVIEARDALGNSSTKLLHVTLASAVPSVSLTATPASITPGQSTFLSWSSSGATAVSIAPGIGAVAADGGMVVPSITATTTYTITAIGTGGTSNASATVTVIQPAPVINLSLSPSRVSPGQAAQLVWSSSSATSVTISPSISSPGLSGSRAAFPTQTTTYTATAQGLGGTATAQATLVVDGGYPPRPSVYFSAALSSIAKGQSTTLSWQGMHANTVSISPGIGVVPAFGSVTVSPSQTTTYVLTAVGFGGTTTGQVTVSVGLPMPAVSFSASPSSIEPGQSATLTWSSSNATAVNISPEIGNVDISGSSTVSPPSTTTYTITAAGVGGVTQRPVTVTVAWMLPTVSISADPPEIGLGQVSTLTWTSSDAATVEISPGIGSVNPSGAVSVSPLATTMYTITATGLHGVASAQASVGVIPAPTISLSASRTTIVHGESTVLSWVSSNATDVTLDPGIGPVSVNGNLSVSPSQSTVYTVTATGPSGTAQADVLVNVRPPPPTLHISVTPETIVRGELAWLTWTSTGADSVAIEPALGMVETGGSRAVSPSQTTTYSVTATGPGGTQTATIALAVVDPPPTVSLIAEPATIDQGQASVLSWTSTDAVSVVIEPGIGTVMPAGSFSVSPEQTSVYRISATGPGGQATATVTVTVKPVELQCSVTATSSTLSLGQSTTLSWTSGAASRLILEPGIGNVAHSGSISITPTETTRYLLTAIGRTGVVQATTTVMVLGAPAQPSEGSFGTGYVDLIPADATLAAYDTRRFAVITGLVQDHAGQPLADVAVSVKDRADLGTALTDASGRYSLPVEGGGLLTVAFRKEGLLPAQRSARVDWNAVQDVDTVVMVDLDSAVTRIIPDGDPGHAFVHRGSEVTTEFGTRAATIVLTGDTRAYAQTEAGEVEIPAFELRATEFTTPEAMPANLPPSSAFTYCVDLSASGLENVRFSKPVTVYVDNFLGFDVGISVPAGSYDYDTSVWTPSPDGRVVQLLDGDGDGIVDALDAGGDGLPDDLDGDGDFADEVIGLDDPVRYAAGATFWRVNVSHLTPWDFNWSWSFRWDDIPPNPFGDPHVIENSPCDQEEQNGSYVECQGGIQHEDLPIPGTDLSLHYASSQTAGQQTVVVVPASGDTVPARLKQIIVQFKIGGRSMEKTLSPGPRKVTSFSWDGRDHLGRQMSGTIPAEVRIGFAYEVVYYATRVSFESSFARAGGSGRDTATANRTQRLAISWKTVDLNVHRNGMPASEIGSGWTLSAQHRLSPSDPTIVYKGDGSVLKQGTQVLSTVAGSYNGPSWGWGGYCSQSGDPTYCGPTGLASDPAGNLYVADSYRHCVRKVARDGTVTTVAGRANSHGYAGDGGPATQALLNRPSAVTMDAAGNLYIADTDNYRVRKVDTQGVITTVAGNGFCRGTLENVPANQAAFCPQVPGSSVAADAWGNLYVADYGNSVVSRVRPDGIIENIMKYPTVEGPVGVAVDGEGNLFIADVKKNFVYRYSTTGRITSFAGVWGVYGHSGDGGPAVSAHLDAPTYLFADKGGNVYIAGYSYVRRVDTDGIITGVTGIGGLYGGTGNGTPAITANVSAPAGIAKTGDGALFVVSWNTNAIHKISLPGVTEANSGNGDLLYADTNGLGYVFTAGGRHKATVDLRTGVTLQSLTYGSGGVDSVSDRFGNTVRIERDGAGVPMAVIASDGQRTELHVEGGDLVRMAYPDGTSRTMAYDARGLLTDSWDARGGHSQHIFDESGRLLESFDAEQGHRSWTRTYDYSGKAFTALQRPDGEAVSFQETKDSSDGYTSTRSYPDGSVGTFFQAADQLSENVIPRWGGSLTYSYATDSRSQARTPKESTINTPSGLTLRRFYGRSYLDSDGDGSTDTVTDTETVNGKQWSTVDDYMPGRRSTTSPAGRVATSVYDPDTLLEQRVEVPGLLPQDLFYDERGRLQVVTIGERTTTLAYDSNGHLDYLLDPDGKVYDYTYDLMGRLLSVRRPDSGTVSYQYDGNGNMTVLVNPNSVTYGFNYTANNLRESMAHPLSGSWSYLYDGSGRLQTINLPSGWAIQNVYVQGNLASTTTLEGTTAYSYASGGRLAGAERDGETISLTHDGPLVTSTTQTGTIAATVSYAYGNDLTVNSMTYAGASASFGYDADGLLVSADGFAISRNAQNGLPEQISGHGLTQERVFNGYGELDGSVSSIAGNQPYAWSVIARDNAGRITHREEAIGGELMAWEYSYDAVGRLLEVKQDAVVVESYTYDLNGNRLTQSNALRGVSGLSYGHSIEDHTITDGVASYVFDVDGFLQNRASPDGVTRYDYSTRGELLRFERPDGTILTYVHDPLGRRIAKEINGLVVEKYLWADRTTLLAVYDGNDNLLQRYTYADTRTPVSMTAGGATYFLLTDQVGSLRAVADTSGAIVKRIDYDSFGNIIADSNPTLTVPFGFAGGLHDRDTGLVRFGYRDYSPELGRFVAKDPLDFRGGDTNLYAYVMSDPVNFTDSIGLQASYATTAITHVGVIETTYEPPYQRANPFVQAGVSLHESVHVGQLMPSAIWGQLGMLRTTQTDRDWERAAYAVEKNYLLTMLERLKPDSANRDAIQKRLCQIDQIVNENFR